MAGSSDSAAPRNVLSSEYGASVLHVTHESTQLGSAAVNLLIDREDHLWIADRPPQQVCFSVAAHAEIKYVGWYVWHDYLTNPKTVEISSGPTLDRLKPVMSCTAYPGSGVQLWELSDGIPPTDRVIAFRVVSTFGGSYTYMNRVYAFTEHPGSKFVTKHSSVPRSVTRGAAADPRSPGGATMSDIGSPFHMSALLRDLDEDIRSLHPLKTNAPIPEMAHPEVTPPRAEMSHVNVSRTERSLAQAQLPPAAAVRSDSLGLTDQMSAVAEVASMQRIASLEASVMNLIRVVEAQSQEIHGLRNQLAQQPQSSHVSRSGAGPAAIHDALANFPEEALRNYVEDIMAPKLAKHSRRFEARVVQRMDEHLQELLRNVNAAVEEQVARHMRKVALSVDESYRHVAKPTTSHTTSRPSSSSAARRMAPTH